MRLREELRIAGARAVADDDAFFTDTQVTEAVMRTPLNGHMFMKITSLCLKAYWIRAT